MSVITDHLTNDEILQLLGERFRAHRLGRNLPVDLLAGRGGVNRKTVLDMEAGRDVRVSSLIKMLRGMGMLGALDAMLPDALPSDMAFSSRGKVRKNAYRPLGKS